MGSLRSIDPSQTQAWADLQRHYDQVKDKTLKEHFSDEPQRPDRYGISFDHAHIDYSKNLINSETLRLLISLAKEMGLEQGIQQLLSGEKINATEGRAVLHTALRAPKGMRIEVEGQDVVPGVHEVLRRMADFVDRLDDGRWTSYTGLPIKDIVNIGIGGSDLGPMMVVEALRPYHVPERTVHFVSNVDGSDLTKVLAEVDPETTLFIIASKTFTTIETMTNAHSARRWFLKSAEEQDIAKHFVALSTNLAAATDFGIDPQNIFPFWDWVGGRFSLPSAIGLSIMVAVSPTCFKELLAGMHAMDRHFASAPLHENAPVILALLGIWYTNFFGSDTEAILPYDQHLRYLPTYLQQACMESNGKSVDRGGHPVTYETGPIIWGGAGTNSQHSFFQLLHQGTRLIPCDFIIPANPHHQLYRHHDLLVSNVLAQTEALMRGKTAEEARQELEEKGLDPSTLEQLLPYKIFEGNRPSTLIMLKKLTPFSLGWLISLYEHRIFTRGYLWNIFSFDQFGVELGKSLAKEIEPELSGGVSSDHDASTSAAIERFRQWKTY